jgi:N-acetylglucosamine-6-sulfatase
MTASAGRRATAIAQRSPVLVLALAACGPAPPPAQPPSTDRPNLVVVVVDDLRWDEFGAAGHPYLETPNIDRLAAEGAWFVNAFHAVPLCSPNRATLLTGQFPSRHGIIDNVSRSLASHRLETFPRALQAAGYRTAFLGKWHMGNDPTPRPGFDYWVAMPGQGRSIDPEFFEEGRRHVVPGYTTDLLTDRAVGFIIRERERPFLVYLAHKAVHPDVAQRDDGSVDPGSDLGYIPAPRHEGRYRDRAFARRGNTAGLATDLEGKPVVRQALARLPQWSAQAPGDHPPTWTGEETIRRRAEMLLAVDEGLGRIMATLDSLDLLDRTAIVFTSDNGFFFGEHGLTTERRLPYEESIRNPLLIRFPPRVPAGARPAALALTVDLAPTLLELAGAAVSPGIQGRSLVPWFGGPPPATWRDGVLVEFYTYENPFPHLVDLDYRAIRTARYKYIHWVQYPEQDELYDLERDSLELRNRAGDPAMAGVKASLRDELRRLVLRAVGLGEREP